MPILYIFSYTYMYVNSPNLIMCCFAGFISRLLKQGEHGGVVEVIFKESDKNRKKVFHLNTDHLMCLNPFASGHSPLINDHVCLN